MEEEEEIQGPLTLDEIELAVVESDTAIYALTGSRLPRLTTSSDTEHVIASFESCVTDFHFADSYEPPYQRRPSSAQPMSVEVPHIGAVVVGADQQTQSLLLLDGRIVAWNSLCRRPGNRHDFEYAHRAFRCVGHLAHPRSDLYLWQVSGVT